MHAQVASVLHQSLTAQPNRLLNARPATTVKNGTLVRLELCIQDNSHAQAATTTQIEALHFQVTVYHAQEVTSALQVHQECSTVHLDTCVILRLPTSLTIHVRPAHTMVFRMDLATPPLTVIHAYWVTTVSSIHHCQFHAPREPTMMEHRAKSHWIPHMAAMNAQEAPNVLLLVWRLMRCAQMVTSHHQDQLSATFAKQDSSVQTLAPLLPVIV
jgi:hypothetical protein